MRDGYNLSLVRYFLERGSLEFMTEAHVQQLCIALSVKTPKFKESKVGMKSKLILASSLSNVSEPMIWINMRASPNWLFWGWIFACWISGSCFLIRPQNLKKNNSKHTYIYTYIYIIFIYRDLYVIMYYSRLNKLSPRKRICAKQSHVRITCFLKHFEAFWHRSMLIFLITPKS